MKTLAIFLAVLMAAPSVSVAQSRESLTAAAALIGGRMAVAAPPTSQFGRNDRWDRVMGLKEGSRIRVTAVDGAIRESQLGAATGARIVLLSASALPEKARELLLDVAQNHPGYIGQEPRFVHKQLKVDDSGIFFDGARIADTKSIIIAIERDAVAEVQRPGTGSVVGGVLGVAAGAVLGTFGAFHLAFRPCPGGCPAQSTLMVLSLAGTPILGGYLGAKAMPHDAWVTVYRRR